MPDDLFVDIPACRVLAERLGTAGLDIRTLGRGGAVADGVAEGFPGARIPTVCHAATRSADRALGAVATALLELGGTVVGAVSTFEDRERTQARGIARAGR